MATVTPLLSTLVMGLLLVALVVAIGRARQWHHYRPALATPAGGAFATVGRAARTPAAWTVAFLVLTFALLAGGLAYVGSPLVPVGDAGSVGLAVAAVTAVALSGYLFAGAYYAAKGRGLGAAQATAIGSVILGTALLGAIGLKLLLG